MTELLTTSQLKRLSEHKYSAEGSSLLEPPMQKFWRWLVEQVPMWWAPNAITIVGLIINILTTLILVYYSPDAKQEVPGWAYILCALGIFVYQSLDAIDGKQARRTKTNTPLGELFDHGCDSMSTVCVILGTSISLQLGKEPGWMLFENVSALFLFYCAHWQTYVSGTLKFGIVDVTEGQLTVAAIHLISAFLGDTVWGTELPVIGLELKMLPLCFSIFGAILQLRNNFSVIFMKGGVGKNGSTVAGTSTIFPVFPIALVIGLMVMIQAKSPTQLFQKNPCLYIISFGLLGSKITNKLVVAHMTKSEMSLFDTGLIGPGMLFLNQYCNSFFNEYLILCLCCFYCLADILHYSWQVCQEICDFLNIYCFTITSHPTRQMASNGKSKKS